MKTLVTGGAGFIGSHLTDYLISKGHEVIVIDNLLRGKNEHVNSKALFVKADIRDKAVEQYLKDIDWVFHTAAIATTPESVADPNLANEINVTGTLNLLLAAKQNKVKKFIFSSSNVVYAPLTPYYVSKIAGEEYCRIFNSLYGLNTISLRYSNVYGSLRANPINCIMALRESWQTRNFVELTGDGNQSRDFTHVQDIVRANLLAANSNKIGQYDICTGFNTTLKEIASYFPCPIHYTNERIGDIKDIIQDPTRASQELGFTATIKLDKESMKIYL